MRQLRLLVALGLPITVPEGIISVALIQQMSRDKLATPEHFNMILPSAIGVIRTLEKDSRTPVPHRLARDFLDEFVSLTRDDLAKLSEVGCVDAANQ